MVTVASVHYSCRRPRSQKALATLGFRIEGDRGRGSPLTHSASDDHAALHWTVSGRQGGTGAPDTPSGQSLVKSISSAWVQSSGLPAPTLLRRSCRNSRPSDVSRKWAGTSDGSISPVAVRRLIAASR